MNWPQPDDVGEEGAHTHTPTESYNAGFEAAGTIDYDQAVEDINRPNTQLRRYARRSRRMIWVAFVAILVALAGLGFAIYSIVHVNQVAHQARVAQCNTGNKFRVGDQQLWAKVLSEPRAAGLTAAQIAQQETNVADFRKFLAVHDALNDCSHLP